MSDNPYRSRTGYDRVPWFDWEDSERAASELSALVNNIEIYQNGRSYDLLRYMSMYANMDLLSLSRSASDPYLPVMPMQILNTTQAIVDTLVSKHVLQETKPTFMVEDGNFADHMRAQDMDKFAWGEFYRLHVYRHGERAFRDALVTGDGYIKFTARDGKVYAERTLPLEIMMDEAAAMSGGITEMYQRRYVSRSWAMGQFPDQADEILRMPSESAPYMWPGTDTDLVRLIEGWHLGPNEETPGRHILCCGKIVIVDEPWKAPCFPFARMTWSPPQMGAYGQGLVQQLSPLQLELNKMMKRIQHSIQLMSVPRVWMGNGTKLAAEFNNTIGNLYKYVGQKPEVEVTQSNAPDLYAQADRIRQRMYEQAGINPVESAQAMPSRIDSRPGMIEYQEITDTRHAWVGKMWEQFFRECAAQIIRVAREIVEDTGHYKVFGRAKDFVEQLDFKDFSLQDDQFVITMQNTNLLPTTPAGKVLTVQKLMQAQMFDNKDDAWDMMSGAPDVDALMARKNAPKKLIEKQIYQIIQRGEVVEPDEMQIQHIQYAKQFATDTYQRLLLQKKVPAKIQENLIHYILACDSLLQTVAMAQPAPGVNNVPGNSPQQQPGAPGAPAPIVPGQR